MADIINEKNKISVTDYLKDNTLLELTYLPFESKLQIVSHIMTGMIESLGGLNTSLLRRISTETFIESITNIDMSVEDENNLKGFDQLCYKNELENLKEVLGNEYAELQKILDERVADYIRMETNPALIINSIYDVVSEKIGIAMDMISQRIQNIDVEKLSDMITPMVENIGGNENEG